MRAIGHVWELNRHGPCPGEADKSQCTRAKTSAGRESEVLAVSWEADGRTREQGEGMLSRVKRAMRRKVSGVGRRCIVRSIKSGLFYLRNTPGI